MHTTLDATQWIASAYVLATAAVLPLTVFLARRFGIALTYLVSLVGFTVVSALCAVAPNVESLIALRILQGCLGAPLVPLAMNLFLGGDGPARVPTTVGLMLGLAPALGPTVGGILIDTVGWPFIFLVNVPLGIAGIVAAARLRRDEPADARSQLDTVGVVLLAGAASLGIYGAKEGAQIGWLNPGAWPFWAAGLLLALAYGWWFRRTTTPAVDLRLLGNRLAIVGTAAIAVASTVMFAALALLPAYLQTALGASPIVAGLVFLPQGVVTAIAFWFGGRLTDLFGPRLTAIGGMVVLALGTASLLVVDAGTPVWFVALLLCGRAFAIGLTIQPLLSAMLGRVSGEAKIDFTTLINVTQRVAGAVGISLILTVFQGRVATDLASATATAHLPGAGAAVAGVTSAAGSVQMQQLMAGAMSQALRETSLLLIALSVVGIVLTMLLPADTQAAEARVLALDAA
jgi:EmrB/QacA subfamily drug resistance transporter